MVELTQAVTEHKSLKMVEHYAGTPDSKQRDAVRQVDEYLSNLVPFPKPSACTLVHTGAISEKIS
jgi:hypothetical protein